MILDILLCVSSPVFLDDPDTAEKNGDTKKKAEVIG
jgi:hypothetical protein